MAEIKKETKTTYKVKGLMVYNGQFVNEAGEVVEVAEELEKIFTDCMFDLNVSRSLKEELLLEDFEEDEESL